MILIVSCKHREEGCHSDNNTLKNDKISHALRPLIILFIKKVFLFISELLFMNGWLEIVLLNVLLIRKRHVKNWFVLLRAVPPFLTYLLYFYSFIIRQSFYCLSYCVSGWIWTKWFNVLVLMNNRWSYFDQVFQLTKKKFLL